MNSSQRTFLDIIRCALTQEPGSLPAEFDFDRAVRIAQRHGILPMLYHGLLGMGLSAEEERMEAIFLRVCKSLLTGEMQVQEMERMFRAFDEAAVDYLPLKGAVMKFLYPRPDIRPMGDIDVLIRPQQYDRIRRIMTDLGYEEQGESDHELIWGKPQALVELHRRLIPSHNKDYYAYFGDGWRLAMAQEGTRYCMTPENELIYLFTHLAKHYRNAGIGIKHLTDLWVYRRRYPALDETYIREELTKLRLYEFYGYVTDTLAAWFDGAPDTPHTDFITDIIFSSGVYGTYEAHLRSEALTLVRSAGSVSGARRYTVLDRVFVPYSRMCVRYPILKKAPVLLPVMWVVRGVTAVLFRRGRLREAQDAIHAISEENVQEYQKSLNYVGLDFHF